MGYKRYPRAYGKITWRTIAPPAGRRTTIFRMLVLESLITGLIFPKPNLLRCKFTPDTCEIDNERFFVRGVIRIPVLDYPRDFGIGAWASLKKGNFQLY